MTKVLHIIVHAAEGLKDVEFGGKNDPYLRATYDLDTKEAYRKTSVKKNAGKNPEWEETLTLDNFSPDRHRTLYVEIYDDETLKDEPIGFTDIPLEQVLDAPGHKLGADFPLFDEDGHRKGFVSLTLVIADAGHAPPHAIRANGVQGLVEVDQTHQGKFKAAARAEAATDVALAAGVLGALIGGKHILGGSKKNVPAEQ